MGGAAWSCWTCSHRWLDDVNIWLKENLDKCTATDLEHIYNSLPTLGEGFRLQEVGGVFLDRLVYRLCLHSVLRLVSRLYLHSMQM